MDRRAFLKRAAVLGGVSAGLAISESRVFAGVAAASSRLPSQQLDRTIRYMVIPHPDDEFTAWTMVANQPSHYVVFILLTRGERSGFCDGHGITAGHGMRVPNPAPTPWSTADERKAARLDAWHAFLDDMGRQDGALGLTDAHHTIGLASGAAHPFDLFVGPRSARAVFDLGDSTLTSRAVAEAVRDVQRVRSMFPVNAEGDIVASAYYNTHFSGHVATNHPDHLAVQVAVRSSDFGLPGPSWGRTAAPDPAAVAHLEMPAAVYDAAMAVRPGSPEPALNPNAVLVGAFQRNYAWLAFDHRNGSGAPYWPAGRTSARTPFSAVQDFWARSWR